jgi:tRNA (guanine-N7-)-methyltransferase
MRRLRVRHHVNPLRADFVTRGATRMTLPNGPVEVEIGCADARFLFERAPRHPHTTFVGLEIREPLVDDVNQRAAEAGLSNLRASFAHVNHDLDSLFEDARLTRVFINFPDPWFKRRHHKRRVLNDELADVLAKKIHPGGELFFQSDIWDIALDAMATLEAAPAFVNQRGEWSFCRTNPYDEKSLREVRCEERLKPIWRILYRRR